MPEFQTKPVTKECRRFIDPSKESPMALTEWMGKAGEVVSMIDGYKLRVVTKHGPVLAEPGCWIIRQPDGEFYPCDNETFERTYQAASVGVNVFEGKPDGRQSADVNEKVSRFRPKYRALTDEEKKLHDEIKAAAVVLERMIEQVQHGPDSEGKGAQRGRYCALAMTHLEDSVMWLVKGLTL